MKRSAAVQIAEVSWFIESKGLPATAEKFADAAYDFIERLADKRKSYRFCKGQRGAYFQYKCVNFKKYTVVFIESERELIICEFVASKMMK